MESLSYCKSPTIVVFKGGAVNDGGESRQKLSTLILPFKSYLVTEAEQQMRDERNKQRHKTAVTSPPAPVKLLIRFLTTIHFEKSLRRPSG